MSLFSLRKRLMIQGIMPERALLRLKRAKIDLYNVKKVAKNQILLSVNRKDIEKVFAFYPNVCYNRTESTPYTVKTVRSEGLLKGVDFFTNRIGLALGALLFLAITLLCDGFIFGITFTGTDVYARESYALLESVGVKPFTVYKKGKEDWICANLLKLDGVEYCSVKKTGMRLNVELRLSPFSTQTPKTGNMYAGHSGTLMQLAVLKGAPIKKAGDKVEVGEALVENVIRNDLGEQVRVEVVARAVIACTYEAEITAKDELSAFAQAYLSVGFSEKDALRTKEITQTGEETFHVKMEYVAVETINL